MAKSKNRKGHDKKVASKKVKEENKLNKAKNDIDGINRMVMFEEAIKELIEEEKNKEN